MKALNFNSIVLAMLICMAGTFFTSCGGDDDNNDDVTDFGGGNTSDANTGLEGLKEIYYESSAPFYRKDIEFQNPKYDELGRLTYYEGIWTADEKEDYFHYRKYDYYENMIIMKI